MEIKISDLEKILAEAKKEYGPDSKVLFRMVNSEQFDTGWYDTFEEEGISIDKNLSKTKDSDTNNSLVFIEIKPVGY